MGETQRSIPDWIPTKDKIYTINIDIVDRVLCCIREKEEKYSKDEYFLKSLTSLQLQVNDMFAKNHEPMVLRIGPNKWDKNKPDVMAFHKLLYLSDFFKRTDNNLEQFLRANFDYFSKSIEMFKSLNNWSCVPDDVLGEMLILDGFFIIELFLKNNNWEERSCDPLFSSRLFLSALSRDLLLLDNQLPFEVLKFLFHKSGLLEKVGQHVRKHPDQVGQHDGKHPDLTELAFEFLERILPTKKIDKTLVRNAPVDLRSVVYEGLIVLRLETNNHYCCRNVEDDCWNWKSATELLSYGVQCERNNMADSFVDINFTDEGVLKIPHIRFRYGTACSINMLLEVENNFFSHPEYSNQQRWVSDYLWFMNSLLKSPSDVQLLRDKNIIDNRSELRDNAAFLKFLKDSCESLTISPHNFRYREICERIDLQCNQPKNLWFAIVHEYFNRQWSFFATLLSILTIAQAVFSIASYYKDG